LKNGSYRENWTKGGFYPVRKKLFKRLKDYYTNIRKIGLEYECLDYSKCLDFLLMTVKGMDEQE
jgi:hypothetical protein